MGIQTMNYSNKWPDLLRCGTCEPGQLINNMTNQEVQYTLTQWSKPELVAEIDKLRTQLAAAQAAIVAIRDQVKGYGERPPALFRVEEMCDDALKGDTSCLDAYVEEKTKELSSKLAAAQAAMKKVLELMHDYVYPADVRDLLKSSGTSCLDAAIATTCQPLVAALQWCLENTRDNARVQNKIAAALGDRTS